MAKEQPEAFNNVMQWIICAICLVVVGGILSPLVLVNRPVRHQAAVISNLKQIGTDSLIYSDDYDNRLPEARKWMDAFGEYGLNEAIYTDPSVHRPAKGEYGFAFFARLSRFDREGLAHPEEVPLAFQSRDLRWNASGGLELLPSPPREAGSHVVVHADSSCRSYRPEAIHGKRIQLELAKK